MSLTLPGTGLNMAMDQMGTPTLPLTNDYMQWCKILGGPVGSGGPWLFGTNVMANAFPFTLATDQPSIKTTDTDPASVTGAITTQDTGVTSTTNPIGQTILTGLPLANSHVDITLSGAATLRIEITSNAAATGTVVFEASTDGGTYYSPVSPTPPGATAPAGVASVSFAASATTYFLRASAAARTTFRVRATALSGSSPSLAVTLTAGRGAEEVAVPSQVFTSGYTARPGASFTRPANTTPYAAGQVLADSTSAGTVRTFAGAARYAGGAGDLVSAQLVDSVSQTLPLQAVLHLFSVAPTTTINDAQTWAPTYAEMQTYLGSIQFTTFYKSNTSTAASALAWENEVRRFVAASGQTSIFGVLVALNAYVPVSAEQFDCFLGVNQF